MTLSTYLEFTVMTHGEASGAAQGECFEVAPSEVIPTRNVTATQSDRTVLVLGSDLWIVPLRPGQRTGRRWIIRKEGESKAEEGERVAASRFGVSDHRDAAIDDEPSSTSTGGSCSAMARTGPNDDRSSITELIAIYEAWHTAEPDKGHDATATEWKSKLPPAEPPTQ